MKPMIGAALLAASLVPVHAAQGINPAQLTQAINQLATQAQQQITAGNVPGLAVAVVHQGRLVYSKGYGVREAGKAGLVSTDTVFQLASLSKPVGATVVAALVAEGKISWDSKLNLLDPGFALQDPWVTREITVRDMYSHRSGLPAHAGDAIEDLGYDGAEVIHRLRYQKAVSSFRSTYAYTNFGLTAAGVAAARAYGLDWATASEQKLYKPLGMWTASSRFSDFMAKADKALGHVRQGDKWVHTVQRNPDAQSPAGGVSASVSDLSKWMLYQLAQAGKNPSLDETHHPHMLTGFGHGTGLPNFYGLGWGVNYDEAGRLRLSHSGGFAMGASTRVILLPSEQLGVIVLTNVPPVGVAEGLAQNFVDTTLYGKPTQDWLALFRQVFSQGSAIGLLPVSDFSKPPTVTTPPLANDAYIGRYGNNPLFGEAVISEQAGQLVLTFAQQKVAYPLRHYQRDTFTYDTIGENAVGPAGVTFTIGSDGKASEVSIENLSATGQGVFRRSAKAGQ
ncbi:serine hydrolase [Parachitinimonas caeni]|uniref:Serine hydrolase n=1 Tax=Parachitinimonas caeni TaxID=3031301 RepID=A0ABT7DSH8_9NEIS|nr:serine hydrolase [Parachitinimonas caeni]MDK2123011.1 serine hydrolase [Parachitinimonas caeni]